MPQMVAGFCFNAVDPRMPEYWGSNKKSLQQRVNQFRYLSPAGRYWGWCVLLGNVASSVLFVCLQYASTIVRVEDPFEVATDDHATDSLNYETIELMMYALTWIYILDFICRFIAATDRTTFLIRWRDSPIGILRPTMDAMDLLAILAIQISFFRFEEDGKATARYDLALFASIRILYVIEAVTMLQQLHHKNKNLNSNVDRISRRLLDTGLTALSIIFIGAALFMHIENWSAERSPKLEYFPCVYFIVTTMTTVGYGDISPSSNLAYAFTICLMMYLIIVLFPLITDAADIAGQITTYNAKPARYAHQPVIIWQCGGTPSIDTVEKFALELFHPDQPQKTAICIVSSDPPSNQMEVYLSRVRADGHIAYIEGSLFDDDTCSRAGVEFAKAIILQHAENCPAQMMLQQDEEICITAVRLRQYVDDTCMRYQYSRKPARLVLVLNHTSNSTFFTGAFYGATPKEHKECFQPMSLRELQYQALAKGIYCPGFHPFMANMAAHVEGLGLTEIADAFQEEQHLWLNQYFTGAALECYTIGTDSQPMPKAMLHVPVAKLSAVLFNEKGCILLHHGDRQYKILAPHVDEVEECVRFLATLDADDVMEHCMWEDTMEVPSMHRAPTNTRANKGLPPLGDDFFEHFQIAYNTLGFDSAYGPIKDFSQRHLVIDPRRRNPRWQDEEGNSFLKPDEEGTLVRIEAELPELIQRPGRFDSRVDLEGHIVLIGGDVEHVAHFVRVLRTTDIDQHQAVVILTHHLGNANTTTLFSMFEDVYLVQVPEEDAKLVSIKTLEGVAIRKAHSIVLTATGGFDGDSSKMDHHQMCLRMLIRQMNPTARCILEMTDFSSTRFFCMGNPDVNAWSDDDKLREYHHAVMSKKWVHRPDMVNRASCVAGGLIVEEDMLLPIVTSCVHKSSDIHLLQALLGGSQYDFSLKCVPIRDICTDGKPMFVSKSFGEIYSSMCQNNQIPLALFRRSRTDHQDYIYTCPAPTTILRENDMIYLATKEAAIEELKRKKKKHSNLTRLRALQEDPDDKDEDEDEEHEHCSPTGVAVQMKNSRFAQRASPHSGKVPLLDKPDSDEEDEGQPF